MKLQKPMLILLLSTATVSLVSAQFVKEDFTIETIGLSEEYSSRYKDPSKIELLASFFNKIDITHEIAPIKIVVSYENGEGYVTAIINYDHDKIFSSSNNYSAHNRNWSRYGKGLSVLLPDQIFMALSGYKKSVATKDWLMDKDLLRFKSTVVLKKSNGDRALFYAYNYLDSRGFYPTTFYKNVHIVIGQNTFETSTENTEMLNEMKYFFVGKTTGIGGEKTGAYYFCQFFNIKLD